MIIRNVRLMGALLALLGVAVVALAAAKYTVTATIYNYDANNNTFTLQSDGTSSAVYSTGSGLDSGLTPNVGAGSLYYQWGLDLTNSSRSFYLTLIPLPGSPSVFSGPLPFNGQRYSRCFTGSGGYQNWTPIQYADASCAMRVNFTYNGVGYSLLVMSPSYPGTGTATVTCPNWSPSSKSCSAWTEVPTAGIMNANI
jgi:hypothetical protein